MTRPRARRKMRPAGDALRRIDGARHWRKTLDQYTWFLLRAGISGAQIRKALNVSLRNRARTRALSIPAPDALEYSRILTHWQTEPEYMDERGVACSLRLTGRGATFSSLVRQALPSAQPPAVLAVLKTYHLVGVGVDGRVKMRANAFLPQGKPRAQFLAYTLTAIEGIMDTCYANMTAKSPDECVGQLQRMVIAERFDLKHLAEYDAFLRDEAATLLTRHDAWLKRREVKGPSKKKRGVGYVGVGIFGVKAR